MQQVFLGWVVWLTAILPVFFPFAAAAAATPAVSSGFNFALALNADGTLSAWGRNDNGQLGNGQAALRPMPAKVAGLARAKAVAAGGAHTLVLLDDGTLWGFGINSNGQLGDGTTQGKFRPVQLDIAGNSVSAIAAGNAHSLAVGVDGSVLAWGAGGDGQIGNNSSEAVPKPVKVTNLPSKACGVAAGGLHSLALLCDGGVWAWGDNSSGQLGIGSTTGTMVPRKIDGLSNIVAVSSKAFHNLALDSAGRVWAWGSGGWGALGDGTTKNRSTPFMVAGLPKIAAIEAGNAISMAVAVDGSVWAWGNNTFGQFGDSRIVSQLTPLKLPSLAGYSRFSVGEQHVIAYDASGTVQAWGWNSYGQLGVGDVSDRPAPAALAGLPKMRQFAARAAHTVALAEDGGVWTWGSNGNGESGDVTVALSNLPVAVQLPSGITDVSAGAFHALALDAEGSVWAWGGNNNGALGNNSRRDSFVPLRIPGLNQIKTISAGSEFSLALDSGGVVWAWGSQDGGRLGNGWTDGVQLKPLALKSLTSVAGISAGYQHAMALRSDGTVWAWGANGSGQVGDGTTINRSSPVQVSSLANVTAISAGDFHSLALDKSGAVWAWGYNNGGQLGDGSTVDRAVPVRVGGLSNVVAIAAGDKASYALTQDGRLWGWGFNDESQLGVKSSGDKETAPVPIPGIDGFRAVSGRSGFAAALRSDGTVWTWGRNFEGQLGDGTFAERAAPVLTLNANGTQALDLDAAVANAIPAGKLPPLLARAARSGDLTRLNLSVALDGNTLSASGALARQGFAGACGPCEIYVAAVYDGTLLLADEKRNWVVPLPEQINNNALPAFLRGAQVSTQAKLTMDILQEVDVSGFPGAQILVGYGSSAAEMLGAGRYYPVFTVPRK